MLATRLACLSHILYSLRSSCVSEGYILYPPIVKGLIPKQYI